MIWFGARVFAARAMVPVSRPMPGRSVWPELGSQGMIERVPLDTLTVAP